MALQCRNLEQQLSSQAASFQRQLHGLQRRLEQSAAQKIQLCEVERQQAEQECERVAAKTSECEAAAAEALQKAETCRRAEQQANETLERLGQQLEQVTASEKIGRSTT